MVKNDGATHRPVHRSAGLALALASALTAAAALAGKTPQVGDLVDLAAFGTRHNEDGIGIEWDEPRDILQVRLSGVAAEAAPSLELHWWAAFGLATGAAAGCGWTIPGTAAGSGLPPNR